MGEEVATPTEKKSYYAIIPANVRYDKRLKANAKLLYGEITALCNEKGYCWANNNYFSNLYEVSITSISKLFSQLQEYGYIRIIIKQEEGNKRYVFLNHNVPIEEKFKTSLTKVQDLLNESSLPIEEKFKHNNTTNTTSNNTNNISLSKKSKFSNDSIEYVLSKELLDNILGNNPKFKMPNLFKWSEHIDYMLRLDNRTVDDIRAVIVFSQTDSFWSSNILSTKKLREKFDQLYAKVNKSRVSYNPNLNNDWRVKKC